MRASAPLSRIWVSRTTLGADSAGCLGDDGGDGLVPEPTGALTGALDDGVELLVGQRLERAVDLLEARTRRQEKGQDFARELLPLGIGQSQDFLGE